MQQLKVLIKMAFRLSLRNKFVVLSMLVFPVLSTFLIPLGYSGSGVSKTAVIVYSPANNVYSRAIIDSINSESIFYVAQSTASGASFGKDYPAQFKQLADTNAVNMFVYIPPDIGSRIEKGEADSVVVYDTGNDQKSKVLDTVLTQVLTRFRTFYTLSGGDSTKFDSMVKAADVGTLKGVTVSAFSGTGGQNSQKSETFDLVLGFFSWFAIWGSSYAITMIIRERELKVFKRILLTNTGTTKYLASKFAIGVIIGIIQVALMLISFKYIVRADYLVHLWQLGLLLFGFTLVAITINLAIVSFCAREGHVTFASIIVVNVTAMLSGSYWPMEVMPVWMQNLSYFTPQRWVIYTIGRLLTKQSGAMLEYWLVVLGFMAFFSALAFLGFKYRSRLEV
jgi:ABC-2 type transport system permease protein